MTTLATDDFNRADGGLGANYTTLSGFAAPQISSNTAVDNAGADSAAIYSGVAIPDNHWAQLVRTGADGGGVILRGTSGAPSTFYVVNIEGTFGASAHLVFGEFSGGSFTSNSDQVITFNSGDTLYAEAQGSSLLAKRNGSALGSGVTDSTYTTGDPGLFGFTGYVADDFAAGDFAASGAVSARLPQFPNKGAMPRNYGARVLGARQGFLTTAGPLVIAIGMVTENDSVFAVAWAPKKRFVTQVIENDSATAITRRKIAAVAQVTENDSAFGVARLKRKLLGLVTENDSAFGVTRSGVTVAVGQVTENDSAFGVTHRKLRLVSQVTENDSALVVTPRRVYTVTQASELDSAFALARIAKVKGIGLVIEIDSALAVTRLGAAFVRRLRRLGFGFGVWY